MSGQGKTQENRARAARTDLTQGSPARSLLLFAFPLILGNLFQQFYTMADSMIVGRFVGEEALAAIGASYALTNVFICIAIGGGTYVHGIPGGVAFGASMPGFVSNLHGPDERVNVADLLTAAMIYTQVILDVCGE